MTCVHGAQLEWFRNGFPNALQRLQQHPFSKITSNFSIILSVPAVNQIETSKQMEINLCKASLRRPECEIIYSFTVELYANSGAERTHSLNHFMINTAHCMADAGPTMWIPFIHSFLHFIFGIVWKFLSKLEPNPLSITFWWIDLLFDHNINFRNYLWACVIEILWDYKWSWNCSWWWWWPQGGWPVGW